MWRAPLGGSGSRAKDSPSPHCDEGTVWWHKQAGENSDGVSAWHCVREGATSSSSGRVKNADHQHLGILPAVSLPSSHPEGKAITDGLIATGLLVTQVEEKEA